MAQDFQHEAFCAAYIAAFEAGDGVRIAAFYNAPSLTVRGDGSLLVLATRTETAAFFQTVVDTYREAGMDSFTVDNPEVRTLGSACVNFACDWKMLGADRDVIRAWRQTYTLKRDGGEWRIIAAIFHVD